MNCELWLPLRELGPRALVPTLPLPLNTSPGCLHAGGTSCPRSSMLKVISLVRIRRMVVNPRGEMAAVGPCRNGPQLCAVHQGWGCGQHPLLHVSHPLLVCLSLLRGWHPGLALCEEEEEEAPADSGPRVAATQICQELQRALT